MIEIKVPSQQRYTRVDVSSTSTNNTYLIFAYDFKTLTKEEKESSAIDKLMNRLTYQLRKTILDTGSHIKKLYLEEIIATVKENVKNGILSSLKEFQSNCNNFRTAFEYESEMNQELALLERFDMMNSIFVTFSLDEDNDTLIIHDSFQNGQQMLELTQTTHGLLHQIDVKRASFSNQGELLLSIKYQKED